MGAEGEGARGGGRRGPSSRLSEGRPGQEVRFQERRFQSHCFPFLKAVVFLLALEGPSSGVPFFTQDEAKSPTEVAVEVASCY